MMPPARFDIGKVDGVDVLELPMADAAAALGVSREALRQRIRRGSVEKVVTPDGRELVRVPRTMLPAAVAFAPAVPAVPVAPTISVDDLAGTVAGAVAAAIDTATLRAQVDALRSDVERLQREVSELRQQRRGLFR